MTIFEGLWTATLRGSEEYSLMGSCLIFYQFGNIMSEILGQIQFAADKILHFFCVLRSFCT